MASLLAPPPSTLDHPRYECAFALALAEPEQQIVAWLNAQPAQAVWTTSVTVYELRFGIELLARSRKRQQLEIALEKLFSAALVNEYCRLILQLQRIRPT